jgi:hypothetical protein
MKKGPWKIDGVEFSSPAGQVVTVSFSHLKGVYPFGLVMPRREFDFLVWQQVQKGSNIEILENWEVKDFIGPNGSVRGVKAQSEGRKGEFRAKFRSEPTAPIRWSRRKQFLEKELSARRLRNTGLFPGGKGLNPSDRNSLRPGHSSGVWLGFPHRGGFGQRVWESAWRHLQEKNIRDLFQTFVEGARS